MLKSTCSRALLAALSVAGFAAPAQAEAGDWYLRLRAVLVAPNDKSGPITPAFPTEHVGLNNFPTPEVDLTYMATDNIGFELVAATSKHNAHGTSGTTGGIGKLLSTWVLPPTLTAQYHFNPKGNVRPYVGAGVNYTVFWNEKASRGLVAAVGPTNVHLSDSFGWAAQTGVDIDINPKMFFNLDFKYVDMNTTARLATTAAGTQSVRVKVNPLLLGVGLGFRL